MSTDVVFIHGFTGDKDTWGELPHLLGKDPALAGCRFHTWSYPTKLNLAYAILKYFWTDDPDVDTLGKALRTELSNPAHARGPQDKIVLIGHSMGGLAIQAFVLEELAHGRRHLLDRITEIVLLGTPSNGLVKATLARYFKNQIADMDAFGPFIEKLRSGWTQYIDDRRSATDPPVPFRLTLAAGLQDTFVPRSSSLDPFPFDEKELVPGDHRSMVKPKESGDLVCRLIKRRLLRGVPTAEERRLILGEAQEARIYLAQIRAARTLEDTEELVELYERTRDQPLPRVHRELGLALLALSRYPEAAAALKAYLEFFMPGEDRPTQPFAGDVEATQQLAIAISGAGDHQEAMAVLDRLDAEVRDDPETTGILAGRTKRQWLQDPGNVRLGWRAYQQYLAGLEKARLSEDPHGLFFNGINAAYLRFALEGNGHQPHAAEVLAAVEALEAHERNYWADASCAEALLLTDQWPEAEAAYRALSRRAPEPRHWGTTGRQALDIRERKGRPSETAWLEPLFAGISRTD